MNAPSLSVISARSRSSQPSKYPTSDSRGDLGAGRPVGRGFQRDVDAQLAVALAVRDETLLVTQREEQAGPDHVGQRRVPRLGVLDADLHERDPGVHRRRLGEQRPHLGPGTVRTDQHVGRAGAAVAEGDRPAGHAGDPVAPLDHPVRQRGEQQVAQVAAVDLGPGAVALVGQQQLAAFVPDAHGVAAGQRELLKAVEDAGRTQRGLPGVLVHVEHAALMPGVRRGVPVVDLDVDAVYVQDGGQGQSPEAGSDDGDHVSPPEVNLADQLITGRAAMWPVRTPLR